jgi:hypothetical protein
MTDKAETREGREFRRHKFLNYQGYAFPWYATLIWIGFFIGGMIYFVRYVLLE